MSEERRPRKKYILFKSLVWQRNKNYVTAVADANGWPINEAHRRILDDAEARRLFLPKGSRSENISEGK